MAQSLTKILVQIIFSSKHRHYTIDVTIENELFHYLGGVCRRLECQPIQVGGYLDHVHILSSLSKKITTVKLLQEIKQNSSLWIKTRGDQYARFIGRRGMRPFRLVRRRWIGLHNIFAFKKNIIKRCPFR